MTAKEFLSRPIILRAKIENKRRQIKRLEDVATKCTSSITAAPGGGQNDSSMADVVCKIADLHTEIVRLSHQLTQAEKEVALLICEIEDDTYSTILEKHYLDGISIEKISQEMAYHTSWTYRLHNKAMATAQKILEKRKEAVKSD